jgi:hypothetical protein
MILAISQGGAHLRGRLLKKAVQTPRKRLIGDLALPDYKHAPSKFPKGL